MEKIGKVNILVSIIDENEPFMQDENGQFTFSNTLSILKQGYKNEKNEEIEFNKVCLIHDESNIHKQAYKNFKEALTYLNKESKKIKVKMILDSNEFHYDFQKSTSLRYCYFKISSILNYLYNNNINSNIYMNMSSGFNQMRLALCLYVYNLDENLKKFVFPIYIQNSKNSSPLIKDFNEVNFIDLQAIINSNYKEIILNFIYEYAYKLALETINDQMVYVKDSVLNILNYIYYIFYEPSKEKANEIFLKSKKVQALFKNNKIIELLNYQDNEDYFNFNIYKLVSQILNFKLYLLTNDNENFSIYITPLLISLVYLIMQHEQKTFNKISERYTFVDYKDYFINTTNAKQKIGEKKLNELYIKNKFNNGNNRFDKLNLHEFNSLYGLKILREQVNIRNQYTSLALVKLNSTNIDKMYEFEKNFRNTLKHSSFITEQTYNDLKVQSSNIFNVILETFNNNYAPFKLYDCDLDDFFKLINDFIRTNLQ